MTRSPASTACSASPTASNRSATSSYALPDCPPAPPGTAELFGDRFDLALRYADLLCSDGVDHGLIGPREVHRIWSRHLRNSLAVAPFLPVGATVVDVGTGAGLPGIPLAIARPDLSLTLVEPMARRVRFLNRVVEELSLPCLIEHARVQEAVVRPQAAVARAVARLGKLADMCSSILPPGGQLLALKGGNAAEELAELTASPRPAFTAELRKVVWPDPAAVVICTRSAR